MFEIVYLCYTTYLYYAIVCVHMLLRACPCACVYLYIYTVNVTTLTQDKLSEAFLYYENKVGDDFIKTTCFYHKNTNVYTNLFNVEMC